MKSTYKIYAVAEIIYSDGEIGGGDMESIGEYKTFNSAMKRAIKESYNKFSPAIASEKLHEIWMEKIDEDGELIEQWGIKNGVITFHSNH